MESLVKVSVKMALKEQIINFCIENIKSVAILGFIGTISTLMGFKKEWGVISWILAIITLPLLLIFLIWVLMFVAPYLRSSIVSIFFD